MSCKITPISTPYYYDHFNQMIEFATRVYADILNESEKKFIEDFRQLNLQSQCLYIRMSHRTKPIFYLNDLLYDEIGTCDAIEELLERGYLRKIGESDYEDILSIFTKPKLIELSHHHTFNDVKSNWRKSDIILTLRNQLSYSDFILSLADLHYYIPLHTDHIVRFKKWWKPKFDIGFYDTNSSYNPYQTYVVVDVETTGTNISAGRVTEIGAVKVQDGQIIEEWSSLINPETNIPPFITHITGISNDMVKDAPLFHQIAEDFQQFIGDAIFVAHNVNFDYGFIAAEYKRTGRVFRKPKLCTVASMRQYYPGHSSYSLANMCKEYGISLTTHHRALCDAQAAAQLLLLVNQKRMDIENVNFYHTQSPYQPYQEN